jgi:hypothetical protein
LTFSPRKSFERFHHKLTANEIPGHFSLRVPCRALDVHGPQFQKMKHKALVHALAQASIAAKKSAALSLPHFSCKTGIAISAIAIAHVRVGVFLLRTMMRRETNARQTRAKCEA